MQHATKQLNITCSDVIKNAKITKTRTRQHTSKIHQTNTIHKTTNQQIAIPTNNTKQHKTHKNYEKQTTQTLTNNTNYNNQHKTKHIKQHQTHTTIQTHKCIFKRGI